MKIAVAGTGYVGLSLAVLLSQHHEVTAVDIQPEKVSFINARKSPIIDQDITDFLEQLQMEHRLIRVRMLSLFQPRRITTQSLTILTLLRSKRSYKM